MLKEFKEFAIKGNAVDLAVGVIIGAAFGGIINSLVKDILMPPVSLLFSHSMMRTRTARRFSFSLKRRRSASPNDSAA